MRGFTLLLAVCACAVMATAGCERSGPAPATRPGRVTVASLSPAATDLLLGMGLGDRLVAVSNFDTERPETRGLPRVGDYQTTDWEMLARLRPGVMIVQTSRLESGFEQHAQRLGIRLLNIRMRTIPEMLDVAGTLATAADAPEKGAALVASLRGQFDAVRKRVTGRPEVRVLIALGADARTVVGPDNFLNDLLTMAGGRNVAGDMGNPYVAVDGEQLTQLAPDVVLHLLPGEAEHVLAQVRQMWGKSAQLPAVRNGRVHILTEWYLLLPGSHTADVARKFAELIHGSHGPT